MTVFKLTYDLSNEAGIADYVPLWQELERLDAHRVQQSVWLISLANTAKPVHDYFKPYLDSDDRLFVSRFTSDYWYSMAMSGTNEWPKRNPPT